MYLMAEIFTWAIPAEFIISKRLLVALALLIFRHIMDCNSEPQGSVPGIPCLITHLVKQSLNIIAQHKLTTSRAG